MTILGIITIVVGVVIGVPWIWIVGIVLTAVAVAVAAAGKNGRVQAGRSHYI